MNHYITTKQVSLDDIFKVIHHLRELKDKTEIGTKEHEAYEQGIVALVEKLANVDIKEHLASIKRIEQSVNQIKYSSSIQERHYQRLEDEERQRRNYFLASADF